VHDLMIIGGGPAGLAASVYAARKQLKTLLVSGDIGGQMSLTMDIENYLGYQFIEGPELISKFQTQVGQFPIDQKIGDKVSRLARTDDGFEAVLENSEQYQAKAVILATGKRPRKLNVPGETEYTGRGVSYCAICDGPIFAGQKVVVVGGGNSALEAVLDMVKIAEHVSMISLTQITGDAVLADQLADAKNLTTYIEYQTKEIRGRDFVEEIIVEDLKSGKEKKLDVTGVFIEIGLVPNSDPVKELIELNAWGEVPVTPNNETTVSGLYAAGDVTNVPEKQIIVAAGEGAKAALQAHRYLQRLND
jgi:alkyl hydroperoxide reductase subunit F